ncbi:hypothetical protein [Rhodobacter maris]|uniref:Uncharacterized protein n=1 Tax=Rhodobacter maris TaxID=446682 RepID=A0A285S7C6_9RHOB|nr:hypothetical protein [Rhodobacter maris]SOC03418.1 hypothetical protein SAMN05877831_103357 [Rhodobacter maris]
MSIAMSLAALTRQSPEISQYGNVTLLLWRRTAFGMVLDAEGRAGRSSTPYPRHELEAAIAPHRAQIAAARAAAR